MFSTAGLDSGASSLQPFNHARFKIVQGSFCGRVCVPRPSSRPRDACQFCFTIALEAALFAGA